MITLLGMIVSVIGVIEIVALVVFWAVLMSIARGK
jgi:hypothetical protein